MGCEGRCAGSASTEGDVWAAIRTPNNEYALYSTKAGDEITVLPKSVKTLNKLKEDYAMPGPPTATCGTLFVFMYGLTKYAPKNFDYPKTREAMKHTPQFKDLEYIEFQRQGRTFMGAKIPYGQRDLGKAVVDHITKKVGGSKPQLVCHDPKATKTFTIEQGTGKQIAK